MPCVDAQRRRSHEFGCATSCINACRVSYVHPDHPSCIPDLVYKAVPFLCQDIYRYSRFPPSCWALILCRSSCATSLLRLACCCSNVRTYILIEMIVVCSCRLGLYHYTQPLPTRPCHLVTGKMKPQDEERSNACITQYALGTWTNMNGTARTETNRDSGTR